MKKTIALLLCLMLAISLFAGCGGDKALATKGAEGEKKNEVAGGSFDDIKKGTKLTIGIPQNNNVEDYDTNAYTLWLESETGLDLEFIPFQANATDYKAQLSALLATEEELPDILFGMDVGAAAYEEYGAAGYFLDLAPYYNNKELSANFWERMEELPEDQKDYVIRQLTAEDGGMYAVARIEYSLIDTMNYQIYINQDWLDNLGLKQPTNTQELYNVLKAFKNDDPNQNGDNDELPMIGGGGNLVRWIINMFLYCNDSKYFNVDENNQLYLPHITDEYREALIFINKLMKEGLMFNSAFSMGNKEIKSLVCPPVGEDLTVGIWCGHPTLCLDVDNPAAYAYEALPYWGNATRAAQYFTPAVFVTEYCENPLAAWYLLMTMCTKEGSYRQRYGEYGIDYVDADPGTKSFLGQDAEIKVVNENAFSGQNNCTYHFIMGTILIQAENEVCQLTEDMGEWINHKMKIMGDCYRNYVEAEQNNHPDAKYILPDIVVPVEVSDADVNERSNSQAIITEARTSFCNGTGTYNDPNNDAQWNAYVQAVKDQGYETWMQHRQLVYEDQFPERIPAN